MATPPDSIPVDLGEHYLSGLPLTTMDHRDRAEQYLSTPSEASSMLGGSSQASSLVGEDEGLDDYRMERAYTELHEVYGDKIEGLEQKVRELGDDAAATALRHTEEREEAWAVVKEQALALEQLEARGGGGGGDDDGGDAAGESKGKGTGAGGVGGEQPVPGRATPMTALEGIFSSIDEDGNNVLTLNELLDAMPMTGMDEQQSRDIYKQMDANHE